VFNAGSGRVNVTGAATVDVGATFNASTSTLSFGSTLTVGTITPTTGFFNGNTAALTFGGALTLYDATMNLSTATAYSFTGATQVLSGSTLTLGALGTAMSPVNFPGSLTVRGATGVTSSSFLAGSGTITVTGAVTIDQTATFDLNAATVTFASFVTVGASATAGRFNASSGTASFEAVTTSALPNSLLIQGSSTFDGGTAYLTFGKNAIAATNEVNLTSGTMNLATATTTFNPMGAVANLTVALGTTLTLGSGTYVIPGNSTIAGTLTAGSGPLTISGTSTVSGTLNGNGGALTFTGATTISGTLNSGAGAATFSSTLASSNTTNLVNAASLSFGGLVTASAGTLTVGSQTISMPGLTVSGGTFTGATGPVTFTAAVTNSAGSLNLSGASTLAFTAGTLTVSGGTTTFGSQTVTVPALTVSSGTLSVATARLTVSGVTAVSGGLADFSSTTAGPTLTGAVTQSAGTLTLGSGVAAFQGAFTLSGGTFNARSTTLGISGAVSTSGASVFNANTSTLTFSGAVTVGGSTTTGTFHANTATVSFEAVTDTVVVTNSFLLRGTVSSLFDCDAPGATITFGKNAIAGTNELNVSAGSMDLSRCIPTFNPAGGLGTVTSASGSTTTLPAAGGTFPAIFNVGGVFHAGSGTLRVNGATNVNSAGSAFDGTGTYVFGAAVTTSNGALDLSAAASLTFTAGTFTVSGLGVATFGSQTFTLPALAISGGAFHGGTSTMTVTGASSVSGGTADLATSIAQTFTGALAVSAGTLNLNGSTTISSTLTVSGGTLNVGSATVNIAGTATIYTGTFNTNTGTVNFNNAATLGNTTAGIFHANTGTVRFGTTTLLRNGSSFFADSSASVTFVGAVTLQSSTTTFFGNTGSGSFQSAANVWTAGVFNVGDAASAGRWTLQQNNTFTSGVTVAFPTSGGELSLSPTRVLSLQGPVTSAIATAASTYPKIDCNGCGAGQGITVQFNGGAATNILNIDGLEIDNSVATGVAIASGATYTSFKRVKFLNNVGGAGSVHLALTLAATIVTLPGLYFDTTAASNVKLNGTAGAGNLRGARAVLEAQGAATNGPGAGETLDLDGDTDNDGYGDSLAATYYGSVIEWVGASPNDTAGTISGFPTAAFDWSTFAYYGVYVAYKNTGGAGTPDRLWLRNLDGSAAYSFDVPDASGDFVGSPRWDTENEALWGGDLNGDGDATDTAVHVVYLGTSLGHVIKLIDNGTGLARPATGAWATDYADNTVVAAITSPLIADGSNLYFGGTDGSGSELFGLQRVPGGGEKTIVKTIGAASTIATSPASTSYNGKTYVFVGSSAVAGVANIYRIEVSPAGMVDATCTQPTTSINGSIRLYHDVAYAGSEGGTVHGIAASNFATGGFVNVTGFPFQTAAASPIRAPLFVDPSPSGGQIYFGDNAGNLYVLQSTGTLQAGYPLAVTGGQLSSTPFYRGGVIAVGASDGYVYFVDRHNALNNPVLFKRYFIGALAVSTVAWNPSTSQYLVASADGKLTYIAASDVPDPTPGTP
jgi:fibronectin-binding autotransporter adhesin